jgi:GNAT superfamily N-acetyltransferase
MEVLSIRLSQYKLVTNLYKEVTKKLREKEILQWDRFYPNRFIILQDLKKECFFGIVENNQLLGVVVVNTTQSKQYGKLEWEDSRGKPLIIHRLAVHPNHQGKGIGKKLLQFAEDYAQKNGFSSIRLDVYTKNPGAISIYKHAGFVEKGFIKFPFRKVAYQCFEKLLKGR